MPASSRRECRARCSETCGRCAMPRDDVAALVDAVHADVVERGDVSRALISSLARSRAPLAAAVVVDAVVDRVLARTVGLGPLEALLADHETTEVMVNGPGAVWIERHGGLHETDVHVEEATITLLVERIVSPLGLRVDRTSPLVDARLPDGSRVNVIVPPLAIDGPCITIRRFATRALPLTAFAPPDVAGFLRNAVTARRTILVSGGTGAGKTTLLNALTGHIPS